MVGWMDLNTGNNIKHARPVHSISISKVRTTRNVKKNWETKKMDSSNDDDDQ